MSEQEIKQANKRGAARLAAIQALYQMDIAGTGVMETAAEYEHFRLGREIDNVQYLPADVQWFRAIIVGAVEEQRHLDPMIRAALPETWPLSRLDSILRAILRAGLWELKNRPAVPVAVVVSEYVDIAKAFFDGEEPKITNAVLDRLARQVRPQEMRSHAGKA